MVVPEACAQLSPDSTNNGSKLVCFSERFNKPTIYEVPFGGMTARELCEQTAGGLRDGRTMKAVQIGGALGGILLEKLETRFDFDDLAAEGCMVGHGLIWALHDEADMHERAIHVRRFGAHESCEFPLRDSSSGDRRERRKARP